jgi:tRNA pseudouridine38-40 synthase
VLIGYSGTGYKGMQFDPSVKTIEGDLFAAFVAVGAISKANADDPKKSSLVRCARTDKGVHASGNVISLKLIIEDPDLVTKLNEKLSPQIRVWGIERVPSSFSCYNLCDSRWYEYLLPTHSLLPPHPSTFLARKLVELANEVVDVEGYESRQAEVAHFWEEVEETVIKPILDTTDAEHRPLLEKALYLADAATEPDVLKDGDEDEPAKNGLQRQEAFHKTVVVEDAAEGEDTEEALAKVAESRKPALPEHLQTAIRELKNAYVTAKRAYRVAPERLARLREVLNSYCGTNSFHNYTVKMSSKDPSAKRLIKSFTCSEPFIRDGTEWVSLKVHGQSFMMHQIRKMVGMAALIVRCGSDPKLVKESFGEIKMSIPKAPGLGLLLERPVFDIYNMKVDEKFPDKSKIDFDKYKEAVIEFKEREIYDRIFQEEENGHQ